MAYFGIYLTFLYIVWYNLYRQQNQGNGMNKTKGDALIIVGESILLAVVSYKTIGIWGPIFIIALYIVGTWINIANIGKV